MTDYKSFNRILLIIQIILIIFLWGFTIFHFSDLPKIIPQHYGIDGKPNIYGNKNTILILPIFGTLLFLLLNHVSRNTDSELLNISPKLKAKPKLAETFVNILLLFILVLFSRIIWEEIKIIKGLQSYLSFWIPSIIVFMMVSLIGFNTYYHYKK